VLLEKDADQMMLQEPQVELFGEDSKEGPKVEVKLPPGRSSELADLAQKIQTGEATREQYDAAVNKTCAHLCLHQR
jgi:hypothetical protein